MSSIGHLFNFFVILLKYNLSANYVKYSIKRSLIRVPLIKLFPFLFSLRDVVGYYRVSVCFQEGSLIVRGVRCPNHYLLALLMYTFYYRIGCAFLLYTEVIAVQHCCISKGGETEIGCNSSLYSQSNRT